MGYQRNSHYILTEGDVSIFQKAATDARYFAKFYFEKDLIPWQLYVHHTQQSEITIVGGFGCGKTSGFAMSSAIHGTMTPGFKFMNVAEVAWISHQMYQWIIENLQDTPWWDRFVYKVIERPYPKILIEYIIPASITGNKEVKVKSSLEYMSAQDDGKRLLSWEGDWIHVDEAGTIMALDALITSIGSRLRGNFKGRERMGRLSMTSNSWDNLDMWNRFDQWELDPETYLSLKLSTKDNPTLTEKQIEDIKRRVTDGDYDRWLDGDRPMPIGKEFSARAIEECKQPWMDDLMLDMRANRGKKLCRACMTGNDPSRTICTNCEKALSDFTFEPDFMYQEVKKAGIVTWGLPYDPSRTYLIVGDPGQGNPPKRNAPVILVFDVTNFVDKGGRADIVAFWWGFGYGKYEPFIQQFQYLTARYRCVQATFDSTGTQKAFDDIFNILEEEWVQGTDLNMATKMTGLTTLRLLLERHKIGYPGAIKGITWQLGAYQLPDKDIDQDIVSAMIIAAYWLRRYYYEGIPQDVGEVEEPAPRRAGRYVITTGSRYAARRRS